MGFNVPNWVVIPQQSLQNALPNHLQPNDAKAKLNFIQQFEFPTDFVTKISERFEANTFFAVRSSAVDEDGSNHSFAGQFESYLYVKKEDLANAIKKVWCSAFSDRVQAYRKNNGLEASNGIAIIIQEMIPSEVSGVAFGINPVNGDRKMKLINAVYGLGEGLVSGELDADTYTIKEDEITQEVAIKKRELIYQNTSTSYANVKKEQQEIACLTTAQIQEIVTVLDQCKQHYGKPQDIEFAYYQDKLYLLQARPITNLNQIADQNDQYTLWDNSNIIESYPGVTTPLTFSFISDSYKGAYELFCAYMGVSQKVIQRNASVFRNTLGLINGRVYYNLKTWYQMLALLPGYRLNARFMEQMMGVKERFDLPEGEQTSKTYAIFQLIKVVIKMILNFFQLPRKRKQFQTLLHQVIGEYSSMDYRQKSAAELMQLYRNFESRLLNEWKAPLLNDFFAMIWFGLLEKRCKSYLKTENVNIHNDLLCGSNDIISTQPIHRTIALASQVSADEELKDLFLTQDAKTIWKTIANSSATNIIQLKKGVDRFIQDFGERCIGELKLETISYTQDPTKFIARLQSFVQSGMTNDLKQSSIEEDIRLTAEKEVNEQLKFNFFKKWRLKRTIRNARDLVSQRENLRYERTRAFGIVRKLFSHMGQQFYTEGIINAPRDIFYLTKEEIFAFIEGRSVQQDLKPLISLRKTEFHQHQATEIPSERFATYGAVYHANDFYSTQKLEVLEGDLKGVGCCPGRVKARVQIITDPDEVGSLNGDILVTSSTDPGWVTLFPSASAIIVERGSLLSHSAIVSREMGIPCIVSVTGLLRTLKTGDWVEMDGSTGEIKLLEKEKS